MYESFNIIAIAEPSAGEEIIHLFSILGFFLYNPVLPSTYFRSDGGILLYVMNWLVPFVTIVETYKGTKTDKVWLKINNAFYCFL